MKSLKRIVSLVLTIFLFAGSFAINAQAAGGQLKLGIGFVTAASLRLREQPNTTSRTLAYAHNSEVVVLLEKVGQWYKVSYNLKTGYMHGDHLRTAAIENAELGYGRINVGMVNLRTGPGTSHSILTQAKLNEKAYIIGINSKWFKVIYGNHIGYIRSDYVDLTEVPYENRASQKDPLFFVGGKSTGITPSPSALNGGVTAQQIIATAKKYIGVPYLWGGMTPAGFDCSGYVQYVFKAHGISLPRTSKQQWAVGTSVSKAQLQPGDLVFFQNTYTTGVSHLGIYIGDGQFIHASSSQGVTISRLDNSYWISHYLGAKRIL